MQRKAKKNGTLRAAREASLLEVPPIQERNVGFDPEQVALRLKVGDQNTSSQV